MRDRGDDWFAASYESLADPDPKTSAVPLLLLNVTTVEGGKRALLSPLPVRPREFPDTVDLRAQIGKPLSNSAAAHLSARFMYVSPAATVVAPSGATAGHLVDGGYFENSGADDIAGRVRRVAGGRTRKPHVATDIRPVAIVIENDPYADAPADTDPPVLESARALSWLVETRSPPVTLLHTRDARGTLAQAALRRAVLWPGGGMPPGAFEFYRPDSAVHEVRPDPTAMATEPPSPQRIPLPLGWMLSDPARMVLDQQVVQQTCLRHPALC